MPASERTFSLWRVAKKDVKGDCLLKVTRKARPSNSISLGNRSIARHPHETAKSFYEKRPDCLLQREVNVVIIRRNNTACFDVETANGGGGGRKLHGIRYGEDYTCSWLQLGERAPDDPRPFESNCRIDRVALLLDAKRPIER